MNRRVPWIIIIFTIHSFLFFSMGCVKTETVKIHTIPLPEFLEIPGHYKEVLAEFPGDRRTYVIGASVKGTPIVVTENGTGRMTGLVLVGAIHGNETNTGMLVSALQTFYAKNVDRIPSHMRLFFIPALNPDGIEKRTRKNAHNVDLNRNFPTGDWQADAVSPHHTSAHSGGTSPGSEPEVRAITRWLKTHVRQIVDSVYLVSFHSAYPPTGSVQPGYLVYGEPGPESRRFASFISSISGYKYLSTWITSQPLTGEFIHWCETNEIWACDIELPDYKPPSAIPPGKNETTIDTFKRTVEKLLSEFFNGS
jgi:hypothetical protein